MKTEPYLCNLVKLAKEFVQHVHQFSGGAVAGQPGEAHDVGVQNAAHNSDTIHTEIVKQTSAGY